MLVTKLLLPARGWVEALDGLFLTAGSPNTIPEVLASAGDGEGRSRPTSGPPSLSHAGPGFSRISTCSPGKHL